MNDHDSNEVIVYKPRVCVCPRECCAAQEENPRVEAGASDAEVCCDSSDACCKQACCQGDADPCQSECGSDICNEGCCDSAADPQEAKSCCSEERCNPPNTSYPEPRDKSESNCCAEDEICLEEDECCGKCEKSFKDEQPPVTSTADEKSCCEDHCCEESDENQDSPAPTRVNCEDHCCEDSDENQDSPALTRVDCEDCEGGCCKEKQGSQAQTQADCEDSCCDDQSATNDSCAEQTCCGSKKKICCGTDFCQCDPVDDPFTPYVPKSDKCGEVPPGGGCNGPGVASGCCGECVDEQSQELKERLNLGNAPIVNDNDDCSCCLDDSTDQEPSCVDNCCRDNEAVALTSLPAKKYRSGCCEGTAGPCGEKVLLSPPNKPTKCTDDCCEDNELGVKERIDGPGDECEDSCCDQDSCCQGEEVAADDDTHVTIHADPSTTQKVCLSHLTLMTDSLKIILSIKGMTCAGCVATAERRLKATPGVESYKISLITTKAEIFYDKRKTTPQDIVEAINALSFTATLESAALRVHLTCDRAECELADLADVTKAVSGVDTVTINESAPTTCWVPETTARNETITVSYDPAVIGIRDMLTKLQLTVPSVQLIETKQENKMQHEVTSSLWRFLICLFLTVPVVVTAFLLPISPVSESAIETSLVNVKILIEWILTTPIQVLLCGPFYSSAWKSIRYAKFANVDLLIALSTTVAYLYSVIVGLILAIDPSLVNGDTYFETSALIMTFILLGRYLEVFAKSKTYTVLDSLNKHHSGTSLLVVQDCDFDRSNDVDTRSIPNSLIQRNDVLKVLPGERIPTDEVDEAMLTGEARPQFKQAGDAVFGGTVNRHAAVFIKCQKVPGETTSDMIYQLVEQTQMTKASIENMTDRIAKIFVPVIVSAAVAVFLIWIILAYTGVVPADPSAFPFALNFGLAVLIVSCPCAVGLAVPTATMVGTGIAAKRGILFKGSQIIESLSKARTFCFDKTGTLTTGELSVAELVVLGAHTKADILFYAASIERGSTHPIARAIIAHADSCGIASKEPKSTQVKPGLGVIGTVDGRTVQLGNSDLLQSVDQRLLSDEMLQRVDEWQQQGSTVIYLCLDNTLSGVLVLTDTLKPTAGSTIDYLLRRGHEVWVISGDHPTTVRAIAAQLNISPDRVLGGVLPRDKQNKIKELKAASNDAVVMVGDGMNDGPALAAASVGVALGSTSSHLAQYAAGVVILNDSLHSVLLALDIAKRITGRIKLNLIWAFVYNTLFIPLAAGVLWVPFAFTIPPPFAGLSELVSSVPVVIFSLLLRTYKNPSFDV